MMEGGIDKKFWTFYWWERATKQTSEEFWSFGDNVIIEYPPFAVGQLNLQWGNMQ